jgi:hypothetical protein
MNATVPTAALLEAAIRRYETDEAKSGRNIREAECKISKSQVILRGPDGSHVATYVWQENEDDSEAGIHLQRIDIEMTTLGILAAAELLLEDHGSTTAIEIADTVIVATKLMEKARLVRDRACKVEP